MSPQAPRSDAPIVFAAPPESNLQADGLSYLTFSLFSHSFFCFCTKKLQFSSTYILLDSFTFSILACLLTGYCGLFVAMHLFASSGHNDENDVSNDVDDDGVNKDGNKNYDDDGDYVDDDAPFCEQRPQ